MQAPRLYTVFALLLSLWASAKAQATPPSPQATLAEADRLAMLYNWSRALPLYADAEREFRRLHDPKGVLEARLGSLRAEAFEEPTPAQAAEVDKDLRNPVIQGDAVLMLRCLTAKPAIEEEVNEAINRPIFRTAPLKALAEKRYSLPVGIFSSGEGAPLPAPILAGQRRGRAPMSYDSFYPTFRPAAQARNRLGRKQ